MKISFWISAVVFYVVRVAFSNSVHVGTVLFTTTDLIKKCWSEDDKSLLRARFIMQDVLPDPDCIDFSKPEAAVVLLDYFHACYQIIGSSTYGKVQNLMYLALSDTLGGYLRTYILPSTRKAYYAGQIRYSDAKKLFQLYDDIKLFLKTNGVGWAEPQKICYRKLHVKPLTITGGALDACDQLYTIERSKLHCINDPSTTFLNGDDFGGVRFTKNSKESLRENSDTLPSRSSLSNSTSHAPPHCDSPAFTLLNATASTHPTTTHANTTQRPLHDPDGSLHRKYRCNPFCRKKTALDAKRVIIPLPVLDDCCAPHSIALPFRRQPLRNLRMRNSAFILEYYYVAVIKCFIAKGNTRTDLKNFNSQFHSWLVSQVFPRLSDEKWYPAFGGVLRVLETIRKFGTESSAKDPFLNDIGFMFDEGVPFDVTETQKLTGKERVREVMETCGNFPRRHYITSVLILSLIWIFIFCGFVFYVQAMRGRRSTYDDSSDMSGPYELRRSGQQLWRRKKDKEKFVDFQFLVKFFKKKAKVPVEEKLFHCTVEEKEKEKKTKVWESLLNGRKGLLEAKRDVYVGGETQKVRKLVMAGQGDVPLLAITQPEALQHSFPEAYIGDVLTKREEKTKGGREEKQGMGEGDVQTLWKKSPRLKKSKVVVKDGGKKAKGRFVWSLRGTTASEEVFIKTSSNSCSLEDETKASTAGKRSFTCCCSEACRHSNTTSTKCSSHTQGSTADSENEGDDTYSSDSDY